METIKSIIQGIILLCGIGFAYYRYLASKYTDEEKLIRRADYFTSWERLQKISVEEIPSRASNRILEWNESYNNLIFEITHWFVNLKPGLRILIFIVFVLSILPISAFFKWIHPIFFFVILVMLMSIARILFIILIYSKRLRSEPTSKQFLRADSALMDFSLVLLVTWNVLSLGIGGIEFDATKLLEFHPIYVSFFLDGLVFTMFWIEIKKFANRDSQYIFKRLIFLAFVAFVCAYLLCVSINLLGYSDFVNFSSAHRVIFGLEFFSQREDIWFYLINSSFIPILVFVLITLVLLVNKFTIVRISAFFNRASIVKDPYKYISTAFGFWTALIVFLLFLLSLFGK